MEKPPEGQKALCTWEFQNFQTRRSQCVFGKRCRSVDGAELPNYSGTRPFSLKPWLSVQIASVPWGMV